MGLIGLMAGFFLLILFKNISKIVSSISKIIVEKNEALLKISIEIFQNVKYLITTNQQKTFTIRFYKISSKLSKLQRKTWILGSFTHSIKEPIAIFLLILITLIQIHYLKNSFASVIISLLFFYRSINSVILIQNSLQNMLEFSGSINAIDYSISEAKTHHTSKKNAFTNILNCNIELLNLSFKYTDSDAYSINDVSFKIKSNETTAIVGPSGSGKTTLINLILGLYAPSSGTIRYGGRDFSDIDFYNLRKKIGYVPQESNLFEGSVYDNITMFQPIDKINFIKDKINDCLIKVQLKNFIDSLPDGLHSQVGENGLRLSGGQKQRLCLARELYRDPNLLILDEATSALDIETEKFIQNSIRLLSGKLTIIVIAHRLSTIKNVENILILNKGKISETGSYESLSKLTQSELNRLINLHNS